MPKICYRKKKFNADRTAKIEKANTIIAEYQAQGFELTLRQLYYQFVSRGFIPNNDREYTNLGDVINDARLAGLVDWKAIVDRTRSLKSLNHWDNPAELIEACAEQFRIDKWANQPRRIECFMPDTPVVTKLGIVEIASLHPGDEVLTHIGQWQKITKVIKNDWIGKMLSIRPSGCLPISVTPGHPFWTEQTDTTLPGYKGIKRKYHKANWLFSQKLSKFDLLSIPKLPKRINLPKSAKVTGGTRSTAYEIPLDRATMHVIGLYLSEGSVRPDGRTLQFTFGSTELSFVAKITNWAKHIGVNYSTALGRGTRVVYVYSKALSAWFEQEFGNGAWNKRLPGWLFNAPIETQMEVLKFYFLGDGSFWDESRSSCRAASRSKLLMQTIHFLLLSAGYAACIGKTQDHDEPRYSVDVSGASAAKLAEVFEVDIPIKGAGRSRRYNYARQNETGTQVPVRRVTEFRYQGPVYNLEVENDHSYCVPVAAHNCWIEKDALIGVIEGVCQDLDVDFFSCRGYTSQSEMWVAAMRLKGYWENYSQEPLVLHFGDHDPSGIDMSRDIQDRLQEFSFGPDGHKIELRRLALNMPQVEKYTPPPNPAKITDSRSDGYIAKYGSKSWELDALEPRVIADLIREEVIGERDAAKWKESVTVEEHHRDLLQAVSTNWSSITDDL